MKLIEVSPEIFQLSWLGLVNCFLVHEDHGLTLVDAQVPGCAGGIFKAANALERPLREIVLTHVHGDHVGSLDTLAQRMLGIEFAVGRRESRLLARDFELEPGEPNSKIRGSFSKVETGPSTLLNGGEVFGSLAVIATPGHTPGHLSFFDPRSGTLIAGDALTSVGELRVVGDSPMSFPFANFATWHKPTALASARKLLELEPKKIVCGHGKPVLENATEALRKAIDRLKDSV